LDFDTVIVGAGPYGLSIAAHLRAGGAPFALFGTPLESWRRFMPKGMVLKSERFASNLWDPGRHFTLERYCATRGIPYQAVGSPLSLEHFLEYAEWFRQNAVGDAQETKVTGIRKVPRGFALRLEDGQSLTSRRVVLATGHMKFGVVPPELAQLPEPQVAHTSRMADVATYAGRDVTVIGAGQSALETAALLHEAGARVRVLVRRPRVEWNAPSKPRPLLERILEPDAGVASGWQSLAISELPRVFRWSFAPEKRHRFVAGSYGPSGSWWLKERVEGKVDVWVGAKVESARLAGNRVQLRISRPEGTQELSTDHLIAGTGFRVDVDRLDHLDPDLRRTIAREAGGIPALDSRYQTSVPGLFMAGIATSPVFGPIMRFMYGAKHAAPAVSAALRAAR
jgi:thioredoxin reductase